MMGLNDENQVCPCGDESHAPPVVLDALMNAFPLYFEEILRGLMYRNLGGYWSFERWTTYVGVERDGYIHS